MQKPFRVQPAAPAGAFKTYALLNPRLTHTRVATCAEVECPHWLSGWVTTVDVSTELGQRQAKYIAEQSGRTFKVMGDVMGHVQRFTFSPGQKCFREHRVALERDPLFVVRGGDWRGNPTGEKRLHKRADDWVEDFATHQSKINEQIQKG